MDKVSRICLLFLMYTSQVKSNKDLCDIRSWYLNIISDGVFSVQLTPEMLQLKQNIETLVLNSPNGQINCQNLAIYNVMLKDKFGYKYKDIDDELMELNSGDKNDKNKNTDEPVNLDSANKDTLVGNEEISPTKESKETSSYSKDQTTDNGSVNDKTLDAHDDAGSAVEANKLSAEDTKSTSSERAEIESTDDTNSMSIETQDIEKASDNMPASSEIVEIDIVEKSTSRETTEDEKPISNEVDENADSKKSTPNDIAETENAKEEKSTSNQNTGDEEPTSIESTEAENVEDVKFKLGENTDESERPLEFNNEGKVEIDETEMDETDMVDESDLTEESDQMDKDVPINAGNAGTMDETEDQRNGDDSEKAENTDTTSDIEEHFVTRTIPFGICKSFGCLQSDVFDVFGIGEVDLDSENDELNENPLDSETLEDVSSEIKDRQTSSDTADINANVETQEVNVEITDSEHTRKLKTKKLSTKRCFIPAKSCSNRCWYSTLRLYCLPNYDQKDIQVIENNGQGTTEDRNADDHILTDEKMLMESDSSSKVKKTTLNQNTETLHDSSTLNQVDPVAENDVNSKVENTKSITEDISSDSKEMTNDFFSDTGQDSKVSTKEGTETTLFDNIEEVNKKIEEIETESKTQNDLKNSKLSEDELEKIIHQTTNQYAQKIQTLELMIMKLENQLLVEKLNKQNHSSTITRLENLILKLENDFLKLNTQYDEMKTENENISKRQNTYLEIAYKNQKQTCKQLQLPDKSAKTSELLSQHQSKITELSDILRNQSSIIKAIKDRYNSLEDQNRMLHQMIMNQTIFMTSIIHTLQDLTKQNTKNKEEIGALKEKLANGVGQNNHRLRQKDNIIDTIDKYTHDEKLDIADSQNNDEDNGDDNDDEDDADRNLKLYLQRKSTEEIIIQWCPKHNDTCPHCHYRNILHVDCVPFRHLMWTSCGANCQHSQIYKEQDTHTEGPIKYSSGDQNHQQDVDTKKSEKVVVRGNVLENGPISKKAEEKTRQKSQNIDDSNDLLKTGSVNPGADNAQKPTSNQENKSDSDSKDKETNNVHNVPNSSNQEIENKDKDKEIAMNEESINNGKVGNENVKVNKDGRKTNEIKSDNVKNSVNVKESSNGDAIDKGENKDNANHKQNVQDDSSNENKSVKDKTIKSGKQKDAKDKNIENDKQNEAKDKALENDKQKDTSRPKETDEKEKKQEKGQSKDQKDSKKEEQSNKPTEKKRKVPINKDTKQDTPKDCYDYYQRGNKNDGIYKINPVGLGRMIEVFCDMRKGGWTVIQRRQDGSMKFFREWAEYKKGFGGLYGEHWLGNENIHFLTNQNYYKLRVDLMDWDKTKKYAEYDYFLVENEDDGYRINIDGYTGDAGDGLTKHHGHKFSTKDVDNDKVVKEFGGSCAVRFHGAGWYYKCYASNLNGKYYKGGKIPEKKFDGVTWKPWTGPNYSLKKVEMKIKPVTGK